MSEEINEMEEVIKWMGENIFPQSIKLTIEKFSEEILLACLRLKLIQRSKSKIGMSPTTMKKVEGYMELTEKGWQLYETIKSSGINQ